MDYTVTLDGAYRSAVAYMNAGDTLTVRTPDGVEVITPPPDRVLWCWCHVYLPGTRSQDPPTGVRTLWFEARLHLCFNVAARNRVPVADAARVVGRFWQPERGSVARIRYVQRARGSSGSTEWSPQDFELLEFTAAPSSPVEPPGGVR